MILPFVVKAERMTLVHWLIVLVGLVVLGVVIVRSKEESPEVLKWQATIDNAS